MVERGPEKAGVGGPIPSLGILFFLLGRLLREGTIKISVLFFVAAGFIIQYRMGISWQDA